MALAKCEIVGVTYLNVIWGRNRRRKSGMGKHHRLRVAEIVDPHISKGAANKQLAPPRRKARAATGNRLINTNCCAAVIPSNSLFRQNRHKGGTALAEAVCRTLLTIVVRLSQH